MANGMRRLLKYMKEHPPKNVELQRINVLEAENARLRRFLLSLLRTVWISPEQAEEIISNVCDGKYEDALAKPKKGANNG